MDGTLPENTTVGMVRAGAKVEDMWEPEMLCCMYGVPIGTDKYVHYMLDAKVSEVEIRLKTSFKMRNNQFGQSFFHPSVRS